VKISKTTGSTVRIWGVFTNPDSTAEPLASNGRTLMDPETLRLRVKTPSGITTQFDYGDDIEVVRQSQGTYYYLLELSEEGTYHWEWRPAASFRVAVVLGDLDSVHSTEF
jgi:hypothetical protein